MKKKNFYIFIIITSLLFSCETNRVTRITKEKSVAVPTIETLNFDNRVNISNIVVKGTIKASATVMETVSENGRKIEIKGEGYHIIKDGLNWTIKGKALNYANFISIDSNGSMLDFNVGLSGIPISRYANAKEIVKEIAEYKLSQEMQKLGSSAIYLPVYNWQVVNQDETESFFIYTKFKGDRKYSYTVTITAKAVDFTK